jgi:hypothetical protein
MRIIKGTAETNLIKFRPKEKGFDKENFIKFFNDFSQNKAEQYFKSELIPLETKDAIKVAIFIIFFEKFLNFIV